MKDISSRKISYSVRTSLIQEAMDNNMSLEDYVEFLKNKPPTTKEVIKEVSDGLKQKLQDYLNSEWVGTKQKVVSKRDIEKILNEN